MAENLILQKRQDYLWWFFWFLRRKYDLCGRIGLIIWDLVWLVELSPQALRVIRGRSGLVGVFLENEEFMTFWQKLHFSQFSEHSFESRPCFRWAQLKKLLENLSISFIARMNKTIWLRTWLCKSAKITCDDFWGFWEGDMIFVAGLHELFEI